MNALSVAFCVLTVVTISICQTPAPRTDDWMKIAEECRKKTNANEEDIKGAVNRQIPKTKEGACFMACTKKMTGVMTADNKLNMTALLDTLAPLKATSKDMYEKTVKIFEECKAQETNEPDECAAAKKFSSCIVPKKEALAKASA